MTDDERKLLDAAEKMCRQVGLEERDWLVEMARPSGFYTNDLPSYVFTLRVNGLEVDEAGVTIDQKARDHGREAAKFHGPSGLVAAWALIEAVRARAATLNVEVRFEVRYKAEIRLWQSEQKFEPAEVAP